MKNWQRLKSDFALQKNLIIREKIIASIREFFSQKKYREIDVPLLAPALPAESYVEIFKTVILDRQRRSQPAYLTTSPEVFLKKLLVGGVGNCFAVTKSFRNTEDMSNLHNPEFTILEWYRLGADYKDLMGETEELINYVFQRIYSSSESDFTSAEARSNINNLKGSSRLRSNNKNSRFVYQGQEIDLAAPWERLSIVEVFKKYADMNLEVAMELGEMKQVARSKGYQVENASWEQLFHQIYLNEIEPHLGKGKPTIIYDFPSQMAKLAKKKKEDSRFSERFEVYVAGLELGDCYSELTDWKEQEKRFKKEIKEIRKKEKTEYPYDKDFIEALKIGLPKCSGLAMGVDRLVMLFADVKNIQDVLYFPADQMWNNTD